MPEELEGKVNTDGNDATDGNGGEGNETGGQDGNGGESTPQFNEVFSEDHREVFKDFTDEAGFVKHYKEVTGKAKSLEDKLPIVPETYESVDGVEIAETAKENFEQIQKFAKEELGLTQGQYDKFLKAMIQHDNDMITTLQGTNEEDINTLMEEEYKEGVATLKGEWGNETDDRLAQVQKFIAASGDDEFVTYLNETGLGNNPALVKFMYKISTHFKEDAFTDGKIESNDVKRNAEGSPVLTFPSMAKK